MPRGTKLYGHLYTGGSRVRGYYTRMLLPNGKEVPVCLEIGADPYEGWGKRAGTKPGSVRLPRQIGVISTDRFVKPE